MIIERPLKRRALAAGLITNFLKRRYLRRLVMPGFGGSDRSNLYGIKRMVREAKAPGPPVRLGSETYMSSLSV